MEARLCAANLPSQQEGDQEFKASLGYKARPQGKQSKVKSKQMRKCKIYGDARVSSGKRVKSRPQPGSSSMLRGRG